MGERVVRAERERFVRRYDLCKELTIVYSNWRLRNWRLSLYSIFQTEPVRRESTPWRIDFDRTTMPADVGSRATARAEGDGR